MPPFSSAWSRNYSRSPRNALTPEKVALGWQLSYDPRLSKDETISSASCPVAGAGFADTRKGSAGVGGAVGDRNAPPVINAATSGRR